MSLFKKILSAFFILIVVIICVVLFLIHGIATKGLPDYNATVKLENLKEEVTVYRDEFAVPHILFTHFNIFFDFFHIRFFFEKKEYILI